MAFHRTLAKLTILPRRVSPFASYLAYGVRAASNVLVLCADDDPCLGFIPKTNSVNFFFKRDIDGGFHAIDSVVFLPSGGATTLAELWPKIKQTCKWVHSFYAGVDLLQDFVRNQIPPEVDVPLTNGRGAFSSSLSEYVLTSALHFNKKVCKLQRNKAARKWEKFVMPVLKGKTMGFLGFGHIAQHTARLAKNGFGMRVIAVRRDPTKADNGLSDETFGIDSPDLDSKFFGKSDFVVSTLPGTPATHKIISKGQFAAMQPSAVFISCGRGTVVDEDALVDALKAKSIAGAALDVFGVEPLPEASALWDCEDLLMTCHNADYTDDYFECGWNVWGENLAAFRENKTLVTLVNKKMGY